MRRAMDDATGVLAVVQRRLPARHASTAQRETVRMLMTGVAVGGVRDDCVAASGGLCSAAFRLVLAVPGTKGRLNSLLRLMTA